MQDASVFTNYTFYKLRNLRTSSISPFRNPILVIQTKRILRTLQFTNQFNQSFKNSYIGNTNKNGFYELCNLRTAFKCLFMLNTTDLRPFSEKFNRRKFYFQTYEKLKWDYKSAFPDYFITTLIISTKNQ